MFNVEFCPLRIIVFAYDEWIPDKYLVYVRIILGKYYLRLSLGLTVIIVPSGAPFQFPFFTGYTEVVDM